MRSMTNKKSNNTDPWSIPTLISNSYGYSQFTLILILAPSYILINDLKKMIFHSSSLPTQTFSMAVCQKVCPDLQKTSKFFSFIMMHFFLGSHNFLKTNTPYIVPFSTKKPNYISFTVTVL